MKCLNCGSELQTGDTDMNCSKCRANMNQNNILYGWICPRCGKVHSPYSTQCDCPPSSIISNSVTYTYTLNCDKCGKSYNSDEAFPKPQICPMCQSK
jgi:DNA-directed RNA polymerase subunit RPC12/RpoP